MRKVFPTLLVLIFLLGPLTVVLPDSEDAQLPACCRRNGAHHCAMSASQAEQIDGQSASLTAPLTCPSFPHFSAALLISTWALPVEPAQFALVTERTALVAPAQQASLQQLAADHAGRAPPATAPLLHA